MRTFRITNEVERGLEIRARDVEGETACAAIRVGTTGEPTYVPLGAEYQKVLNQMTVTDIDPLCFADIADEGELRIIKERNHSSDAIVHIAVKPGVGGRVYFTGLGWEKDEVGRRRYEEFPPHTVGVIAVGGNEPELLLLVKAGAIFRIVRTGDVGDSWRHAHVAWNGERLHLYDPEEKELVPIRRRRRTVRAEAPVASAAAS